MGKVECRLFESGILPPLSAISPADVAIGWMPLRQAWRHGSSEERFQRGWARLRWSPEAFCIETVFCGRRPANRATRLNERTWELGEIAEAFLEEVGAGRYLELHVTPENQRLQLLFRHADIERFSAGEASLESFLVVDPLWVASETAIGEGFWAMRAILPAGIFGRGPLTPGRRFTGTFCRYDCDHPASPVLSATAPLMEPSFHRRADWDEFQLVE